MFGRSTTPSPSHEHMPGPLGTSGSVTGLPSIQPFVLGRVSCHSSRSAGLDSHFAVLTSGEVCERSRHACTSERWLSGWGPVVQCTEVQLVATALKLMPESACR